MNFQDIWTTWQRLKTQVSMKLKSEYLKLVPAIVYAGGSASQMLTLFWLSETWPVTLRILEKVFSGSTGPPDTKKTKLLS